MALIESRDVHTIMTEGRNLASWFSQTTMGRKIVKFWKDKERINVFDQEVSTSQMVSKREQANRVRDSVAKNRNTKGNRHTVKGKNVSTVGPSVNKRIQPKKFKDFLKGKIGWKNKSWMSRGVQIGLSVIAWNFASAGVSRIAGSFNGPVIPREYDRGYDMIQERLTDFGSPVKLSKAAGKSLRQYHSSIRAGTLTTVESMTRKNISLNQYRHAIGHRRY